MDYLHGLNVDGNALSIVDPDPEGQLGARIFSGIGIGSETAEVDEGILCLHSVSVENVVVIVVGRRLGNTVDIQGIVGVPGLEAVTVIGVGL